MKKISIFILMGAVVLMYFLIHHNGQPQPQLIKVEPADIKAKTQKGSIAASIEETKKYPEATVKKLKILDEIFSSKNDNDSRIDTDLKNLSDADKAALVQAYRELPQEKRNEKGTIVFLIGRELSTDRDFDFLNSVLKEKECLSLEDCTKQASYEGKEEAAHAAESSGLGVTLNYPQVVTLVSYEKYLNTKSTEHFRNKIADGVSQSNNYDLGLIQKKMAAIKRKLQN